MSSGNHHHRSHHHHHHHHCGDNDPVTPVDPVDPTNTVSEGVELADGTDATFEIGTEPQFDGTTSTLTASFTIGAGGASNNVVFVTDISGSTLSLFDGDAVGDVNGDLVTDTILDAEIASLLGLSDQIATLGLSPDAVEIGLVSFDSAAAFFGAYEPGSAELAAALQGLQVAGSTNYADALLRTIDFLTAQDAAGETNLVYFLSDGFPNVGGDYTIQAQALEDQFGAEIIAVGMGENSSTLAALTLIDNTGGAQTVTSTDELSAILSGSALDVDVIEFTVTVNGVEQANIDATDLTEGPFGYTLSTIGIDDLDPAAGVDNEIVAEITLSDGSVFDLEAHVLGGGYLAEGDLLVA